IPVASATACNEAVATACLPGRNTSAGPLRYLLRVRPSTAKLGDNTICGLPYTFSLTCDPCSLPTGACCTEQGCIVTSRLSCLIQTGSDALFYRGDSVPCGSDCGTIPTNDTCLGSFLASWSITGTNVTSGASTIIPFDTSLAHSADTPTG